MSERIEGIRERHRAERENAYQFGTERKRRLLADDLPWLLDRVEALEEVAEAARESLPAMHNKWHNEPRWGMEEEYGRLYEALDRLEDTDAGR